MTPIVYFWLTISIMFEVLGDVLVKFDSHTSTIRSAFNTLIAYNLMLICWIIAVRHAKAITVPGTIWLLAGHLALILLGTCAFHEGITLMQKVGVALALISLLLLSL